jgi:hypothetical protein
MIRTIREFLEKNGLDPFYTVTVVCIIVTISYWKDFKNWDKIPSWNKGSAASAACAAIVFTIISLLRIIGIIHF